jgi:ABC-type uncharacterized transport system substrate-binding protein
MKRREFITLIGGAAMARPFAARAQQPERMRRVGVLMGFAESDQDWQMRVTGLRAALQELGWIDGRNLRLDVRWAHANPDHARAIAAELVAQAPDALFACPHFAVAAMQRETRTMPIVAVQAGDLVSAGFAQRHARPGGNVTGFVLFEATINTKFLQLLKDIAPHMNRVGVMQGLSSAWRGDFAAIEAVAGSFGVQVIHTWFVTAAAMITQGWVSVRRIESDMDERYWASRRWWQGPLQLWARRCAPKENQQPEFSAKCLRSLAPRAGFEPATNRLTAGCSTAELPGTNSVRASVRL